MRVLTVTLFWVFIITCLEAQEALDNQSHHPHLLFSYFIHPGAERMHYALSEDGLKWIELKNDTSFLISSAGREKLIRDPAIMYGKDGLYHCTWTTGWKEKGIGYAESKDLIHWSGQRYIPVMEQEPNALNCWAPECLYDDENDRYLIYWATTVPGRFPETDGQNKSATSAGLNHRMYYVTTKDFISFSNAKLLYDQGFNVIDASIVKDGNRYIMFLKDETNIPFTPQKNIRMAFSDHAEGPYSKPTDPITGQFWAEGPSPVKLGSRWFVYFDIYRLHSYGVIVSEDLKVWTETSGELLMPDGARHGSVLTIPETLYNELLLYKE